MLCCVLVWCGVRVRWDGCAYVCAVVCVVCCVCTCGVWCWCCVCVYMWCCVLCGLCLCVVLVWCGVWWSLARGKPTCVYVQNASVCTVRTSPCVPATGTHVEDMRACCRYTRRRPDRTHGGVFNVHTGGFLISLSSPLSLALSRSFLPLLFSSLFFLLFSFLSLLSFSFLFLLLFFCACSCSCSLSFPSTHSSLLFPSRQQTLYKALINKIGGQLRGHVNVIWRTAGAQQSVLSPRPLHSLLPSLPLPLLLKKSRDLSITGIFRARNFLIVFN